MSELQNVNVGIVSGVHYTMKRTTSVPVCAFLDNRCGPSVVFHYFLLSDVFHLLHPMYLLFRCPIHDHSGIFIIVSPMILYFP